MTPTNQTRVGLAAALLAAGALAYGTIAPDTTIPEAGTCELHTVFGPCEDLLSLHGAGNVPPCDSSETVGAVLALKLLPGDEAGPALDPGWIQPPGLVRSPVDCGAYEWPEERAIAVPVATMHPESIVGFVGRHATGEGEWATPTIEPRVGYVYGPGAYCAEEPCEHVAIGAVDPLYWQKRLCRLIPDAAECPSQD